MRLLPALLLLLLVCGCASNRAMVKTEKSIYQPGEEIRPEVIATGLGDTSWLGVFPAETPPQSALEATQHILDFTTFYNKSVVFVVAPAEPGHYDLRLYGDEQEGSILASSSFEVQTAAQPISQAEILTSPTERPTRLSFPVPFRLPPGSAPTAWIGFVPAGVEPSNSTSSRLSFEYLKGRTRGTAYLLAPGDPGNYDIRLVSSDTQSQVLDQVAVRVMGNP